VRVSIGLKEDGTPVPFYVNRIPIDLPDGKAVVSFLVDISDIKQLEGALEGERDARDSLAEAIGTPVVILDHEGKVLRWNACARDVSGYSEKEVCGKAFVDALLAEEDRAEGRRLLEQACRGGKVSTFVRPLMCKDGRQMLMRWHCSPLRDGIRGTTGLLLIGYDITKTWPQTPGPGGPA
jgi:PAS domain S-box-containing protein